MNNIKIIITLNYLDYLYLKNFNLKNYKIIYINNVLFDKIDFNFENKTIEKFIIKPKKYKLEKIFEKIIGIKEIFFFINNEKEKLESLNIINYLKKDFYFNKNDIPIMLGFNFNKINSNLLNQKNYIFNKSFYIKKDEKTLNFIINKLLDNLINFYIYFYLKNKLNIKYYLTAEEIKILNYLKENIKKEKKIYFFNKILKKEKINEIKIIKDKLYNKELIFKLLKIKFPFLKNHEINKLIKKFLEKERDNIILKNNLILFKNLNKEIIKEKVLNNKFKYKNKFLYNLIYSLTILNKYIEDEKIFQKIDIEYKNKQGDLLIKNIIIIEEINKENEEFLEYIEFILNKENIKEKIIIEKNKLELKNLLKDLDINYLSFEYLINKLTRKKILTIEKELFVSLGKRGEIITKNISKFIKIKKIKKEFINKNQINNKNDLLKLMNKFKNMYLKDFDYIFNIPSKRLQKTILKIEPNISKEDLNNKKILLEILKNYQKKQKPTIKQIELIKKIFEERKYPKEKLNKIIENRYYTNNFLYKYYLNRPTKKQLEFLKKIEKKYNIKISDNIKKSKKKINLFIKEFI